MDQTLLFYELLCDSMECADYITPRFHVVPVDSSESSGESVSGFSSSGVSCHSTLEGEADNTVAVEEKIVQRTDDAPEHPKTTSPTRPASKKPPPVAPKPLFTISKELTSCKVWVQL